MLIPNGHFDKKFLVFVYLPECCSNYAPYFQDISSGSGGKQRDEDLICYMEIPPQLMRPTLLSAGLEFPSQCME
jgi:hypothetical protein